MTNLAQEGHVYHLYVVRINEASSMTREQVQDFLKEKGIQTGIHYPIPCHLQPAYKSLGYQLGDFPQAEMLCEQILSLPMYPVIKSEDIAWVVEQISLI